MEETESEDFGVCLFITDPEITKVVKKLHIGRAPWVDGIHPKFLKALDVAVLSWLAHLCNIAWTVITSYRVITLLSLPVKVYSGGLEKTVQLVLKPQI